MPGSDVVPMSHPSIGHFFQTLGKPQPRSQCDGRHKRQNSLDTCCHNLDSPYADVAHCILWIACITFVDNLCIPKFHIVGIGLGDAVGASSGVRTVSEPRRRLGPFPKALCPLSKRVINRRRLSWLPAPYSPAPTMGQALTIG